MTEIVTSALSLLVKAAASPAKDAAFRKSWVIATLKRLNLDPKQPPKDFYSLYAYTLVEALHDQPSPVLQVFRDEHVQQSFYRSFSDKNWTRLKREIGESVERNRETGEYGNLPYGMSEVAQDFISKFQDLVSRSRSAYETRLENKLDDMSEMLDQVLKTRSAEEKHRQSENPQWAEASAAQRLTGDVREWFHAVGYTVRREWKVEEVSSVALLVEVPQRRPGKFDLVVALCVEGEVAPYHLESLKGLVEEVGAAEGWGIAHLRVSSAARELASRSNDSLFCYSFDELIDLEADFEPYIQWLEREVQNQHIDTRFVPLACRKEEIDPRTEKSFGTSMYDWREGGLDNYVDAWLADPAKKHLSLLGEFGMGKSWFALHLAGRLAVGWRDAKSRGVARPRIPLVISLRDYAKQTSVSALLSEFFFHKHRINVRNYEVFSVLNRMGRFLLIFDGFDEMASRTDRNTMVANFWELAKIVEPGAKVLLSSRTEYFPEAKEARDLFGARVAAATHAIPSDGPTFEIVELVPFDDDQIRKMLSHLLTPEKLEVVMGHESVRDLMRRPVMSELVIDALPEIEQGAVINLARIYLYAIKRKMDRDVSNERTFTSRADKLFFLCEVAWEMIHTNQLSLNYRDFPDRLRACFGSVVENSKDLDYWEQDMRNQSMLVRNSSGDYGPSHKSLLEFLVAFRFAAELGLLEGDFLHLISGPDESNGERLSWSEYFASRGEGGRLAHLLGFDPEGVEKLASNFGMAEYNPVIFDFLATMIKECDSYQDVLIAHIKSTASALEPFNLGGNCANLLAQAGGSLAGISLHEARLSGFGDTGEAFFDISLEATNLSKADLSEADISHLNKRNANFTGALLRGGSFLDSPISADHVLLDSHGAITVLRSRLPNTHPWVQPMDSAALHWPHGDLHEEPVVVPLTPDPKESWAGGCGIFEWDDGEWGCTDRSGTVIRSSATGEITQSFQVAASFAVTWGDSRALMAVDRSSSGYTWKVVDAATGHLLAVCDEAIAPIAHARVWGYRPSVNGVLLRVSSEEETALFEMTSANSEWVEQARFPVGTAHSIGGFTSIRTMVKEDTVYIEGPRSEILTYPKSEFGDTLDDLAVARCSAFTPDAQRLVMSNDRSVWMLERDAGSWRKAWSRSVSSDVSAFPAMSADGSKAVFAFRTGELSTWSLADGNRMSARSFNPLLRGAQFSRESDLEESDYESIKLSGGLIGG
ncbi:NACHT domain-containing protein [Streptomyces sp. NBC_01260]|uniref:NACHT domain-containing protein n=1 Tax=Streptomyces sp. NBC_01260 TaxID=2903801 RepID=UPI002E3385E0|nr:NACHT domain-containing protein [Streptomyces sp. NBC_01260]